jgi:hypothetical protein
MNFIRNSARPLCFTYADDYWCLIWASEDTFVDFVTTRLGMKQLPWNSKTPNIFTLRENHLLTIPVDSNGSLSHDKGPAEYREVKIKPRPLAKVPAITHYTKDGKGATDGKFTDYDHDFKPPWDGQYGYEKMFPKYDPKKEKKGQKWTKDRGWHDSDEKAGEKVDYFDGEVKLYKKIVDNLYRQDQVV